VVSVEGVRCQNGGCLWSVWRVLRFSAEDVSGHLAALVVSRECVSGQLGEC